MRNFRIFWGRRKSKGFSKRIFRLHQKMIPYTKLQKIFCVQKPQYKIFEGELHINHCSFSTSSPNSIRNPMAKNTFEKLIEQYAVANFGMATRKFFLLNYTEVNTCYIKSLEQSFIRLLHWAYFDWNDSRDKCHEILTQRACKKIQSVKKYPNEGCFRLSAALPCSSVRFFFHLDG